jgi:hypothetical protein
MGDTEFAAYRASGLMVRCPTCKAHFLPPALPRSRYLPETERQAAELVAKIKTLASQHDEGVKQCALMHLEDEWLAGHGHRMTVKLGENVISNAAKCSVCGSDTRQKGLMLHIISRWRNTTTAIYLCEEHRTTPNLYSIDLDLHETNICPQLGPD